MVIHETSVDIDDDSEKEFAKLLKNDEVKTMTFGNPLAIQYEIEIFHKISPCNAEHNLVLANS